jgi:hypothetical protein
LSIKRKTSKSIVNRFGILAIKQEKPRKELIEKALEKFLCENDA